MSAACAAFADARGHGPDDFKVELREVGVMPAADDDGEQPKMFPAGSRIVVPPGKLAVFHLKYDFPADVKSMLFLEPNFKESGLDENPFGTSGSRLLSGSGSVTRIVILGAGGAEPYKQALLLKSVRISGEIESAEGAPRNDSFFICDIPVNVLFADIPVNVLFADREENGKKAKVLEPEPSPAPDPKLGVADSAKASRAKSSTPAGFTDNLDEALAKAKAEGKLVYACFSGSDWCGWCMKLEREVLSDPLFVAGVADDYVLVFIDSPQDKSRLSERAKAENAKLTKKYGIQGFPTALILDGDGKKIAETGYRKGGAADAKCGEEPQKARPKPKAKTGARGTSPKAAETMRRMKAIVLPEVKFSPKTPLADAIGALRDASIDHDSPETPKADRGFSMILTWGDDGVPSLPEIKMKNVRFHDALKTVCDAVRYRFAVEENGVIVVEPGDNSKARENRQ